MFSRNLLAVLAVITAAPALAADVSAGEVQLARIAGVEPGLYTAAQLIQLDQARQENDAEAVRFILASPGGGSVSSRGGASVSAGAAQMALALGVEPGAYSVSDLMALETARRENDAEAERAILTGELNQGESGALTPGKVQLAASLGVDPSAYSLAELTALTAAADQSDN